MSTEPQEPLDVVASVGPLDPAVSLLREFLHRSGALRAVAVIAGAPDEGAALIDCARLTPIEVTIPGRTVHLPHSIELGGEVLPMPEVHRLPPFEVDLDKGVVAGTIGGVEHLAGAVRELAATLGTRAVAMVQFETTSPDVPFTISARGEDPVVLAIGDQQFELD
jgi:hypothetical protein